MIFELYSPDFVDVFQPTVSPILGSPGEIDMWKPRVAGKLDPFILRFRGQVKKEGLGWVMDSSVPVEVNIDFTDDVPRLELEAEPLPIIGGVQKEIESYLAIAGKLFEILKTGGNKVGELAKEGAIGVGELIKKVFVWIENLRSLGTSGTNPDEGIGIVVISEDESKKAESKFAGQNKKSSDTQPLNSRNTAEQSISKKEQESSDKVSGLLNGVQKKETKREDAARDTDKKIQEQTDEKRKQKKAEPVLCDISSVSGSVPQRNTVILNEIAWMGTKNSANDEWIELKNIAPHNVSLEGWQLLDKDQNIKIIFSRADSVASGTFFLLERTDDSSVPNIPADSIYTGVLSNSNEGVYLFDESCALQDAVIADPSWPAGDNENRRTMERSHDFSWHTYAGSDRGGGIYGTPKEKNSQVLNSETNTNSAPPTVVAAIQTNTSGNTNTNTNTNANTNANNANTNTNTQQNTPVVYQKILISEIQIEGQTVKDEFVELYNPNSVSVNLEGWSLKKKTSGGTESNLVSATAFAGAIEAYSYFLIAPPLNSDGTKNYQGTAVPDIYYSGTTYSIAADNAALLYYPNGNVSDKIGWGTAQDFETAPAANPSQGKSVARKMSGGAYQDTDNNSQDFETQTPTPKLLNQAVAPSQQSSPSPPPQPSPTPDTSTPTVPGTPSSLSGATNTTPVWTWTASADSDSGLAQIPYTAQWSLDSAFGNGVYSAASASNSYTHTVPLANGTWYFRVKAKDAANNESAFSPAGSHTVDTTDSTSPQLTLNALASSQTTGVFSLSWSADDPDLDLTDAVLPSGVSSYSIYYATTPSVDGAYIQYKDSDNLWQDWPQGQVNAISLPATQTGLSLWGRDGYQYTFFVSAKDAANNQSAAASASTTMNFAKSVVINEIAWAGTKASATDEWIELFNNTSSPINLAGWRLKSADGSGPDVALSGTIAPQGFYLIERTNNNPTTVTADLTASFGNGISNSPCEVLYMYNLANEIVDQTICKNDGSWPAGTASPYYISMERVSVQAAGSNAANWASNTLIKQNGKDASNINLINGTPRQTNSVSGINTEITDLRFNDASYDFSTIIITKLGSPYYTNIANFAVPANKTLVIEPGVTLNLRGGSSIIVVDGTLQAVGSAANLITFDSYVPSGATSGLWCGMKFNASSQNSRVEYATIKNADSQTAGCGSGNPTFAVWANGSNITLKNSTIVGGSMFKKIYLKNSNSVIDSVTISGATGNIDSAAVYIDGGSPTVQNSSISGSSIGVFAAPTAMSAAPTVSGNTFTGNTYAVKLNSAFGIFSGNSASGNTYNGIFMGGSLSSAAFATNTVTMQADGIPYIINSFTIDSGKTMNFAAGSVVKFLDDGELIVNGALKTYGTSTNPVLFTRLSGSGFWRRIYFNSGAAGSVLEYTNIEYGASNLSDYFGALYVRNQSGVSLNNAQIRNSYKAGIFSFNGNISGNYVVFSGNQYALFVQNGNCPAFTNATFANGQAVNNPSGVVCSY